MDFQRDTVLTRQQDSLPAALVGFWRIGGRRYEIRKNGRYYVYDEQVPYQLTDGGMTLVHLNTRYLRRYGDTKSLVGVWNLEDNLSEEWNLRAEGSYTYHWPEFEYFGEYSASNDQITTAEMHSIISVNGRHLVFNPPYAPPISASWELQGHLLVIDFPTGPVVYAREENSVELSPTSV